MCNLYSITTNQAAIIGLFRVINQLRGQPAADAGCHSRCQILFSEITHVKAAVPGIGSLVLF
jgi:hypothetical protein